MAACTSTALLGHASAKLRVLRCLQPRREIHRVVIQLNTTVSDGKNKETRLDAFDMKGLRKILRV